MPPRTRLCSSSDDTPNAGFTSSKARTKSARITCVDMGNMGCEIWGHVTAHEVGAHHLQRVHIDLRRAAALHLLGAQVAREGEARRTLDEPLDLGAAKVLRLAGELGERDVGGHAVGGAHVPGVDRQDLLAPRLVGQ